MRASKEPPSTLDAESNCFRSILVVSEEAGKIAAEREDCLPKTTFPTRSSREFNFLNEPAQSSWFPDFVKTPGYGSLGSGREDGQFRSPIVNKTAENHCHMACPPKQAVKDLASMARSSVYERASCSGQKKSMCETALKEKREMAAEMYSTEPEKNWSGRRVILPPIEKSSKTQTQSLHHHETPTEKRTNRTETSCPYHCWEETFGADDQYKRQKELSKNVIETAEGTRFLTSKGKQHKPEFFCQFGRQEFVDAHYQYGIKEKLTFQETECMAARRRRFSPAGRHRNNILERITCSGQQKVSEADVKARLGREMRVKDEPGTTGANRLFVPVANRQYRTVNRGACFGPQELTEDDIQLGRRQKVCEVPEDSLRQCTIAQSDKRRNRNAEIISCAGQHEHLGAQLQRRRRWAVHVEMEVFHRQEVLEAGVRSGRKGYVRDEMETSPLSGRILGTGGKPQSIAIGPGTAGLPRPGLYSGQREFSEPVRELRSRGGVNAMQGLRRQNVAELPLSRARGQQEFSTVERQPRKRQGVCQETDTASADRIFLRVLNKRF